MDWWNQPRRIQILVDNDSWILPWARQLADQINQSGDQCHLRRTAAAIQPGEIVFLLGCTLMINSQVLSLNRRNLVVHESDLPEGRGFAPMTWQVLEGATSIPICLLEATDRADAGDVFAREEIRLLGTELCDELREKQGRATLDICLNYLRSDNEPVPVPQSGSPTDWPRRRPADSRLDADRSIAEQFELLRVCDNRRYPAWFEFRGRRYEFQIRDAGAADEPVRQAESPETAASATTDKTYLVAGCKSWNREIFDRDAAKLPGTWHYIGSPSELTDEYLAAIDPQMIFFLHWSWRVPASILKNFQCVCFHMTDLPYGRGGSPLQNLIVRGHRHTMLSALRMTDEIDAGPVYLKRELGLAGTAADVLRRASELSFAMIGEIIREDIQPFPQSGPVTQFTRRRPEQSEIRGNPNLEQLYDQIRMLDGEGYPPAWLAGGDCRYEFTAPRLLSDEPCIVATVTIRPGQVARNKAS